MTYMEATQGLRTGHYMVWHEGDHAYADPRLGRNWWASRLFIPTQDDRVMRLRSDLALLAFTRSSCDDDPGDGGGDGSTPWTPEGGYARPDHTSGWNGDDAGAINRFLEWESASLVDELTRFSVRVHVLFGEGSPPPYEGAPSLGDLPDCPMPITADVTPRRTQRFQVNPGEIVAWRFGSLSGEVAGNEDGSVTIPSLPIVPEWTELLIERSKPPRFTDPARFFLSPPACAP
jgi:hypothetical protein